jgi:Serine/Threonine/Tyrosine Kinase found in polyvalent proteins
VSRAERDVLCRWALINNKQIPFDFVEQFTRIGAGAEHCVYYDQRLNVAIKATHVNTFGHSVFAPGCPATPSEYLRRLGWSNLLFGDDFKMLGVSCDDEGQIQVVISQPWIDAHEIRSVPFEEEIDEYFRRFGFRRLPFQYAPLYYNDALELLVGDAHDMNVLRDKHEELAAIDIVIGTSRTLSATYRLKDP